MRQHEEWKYIWLEVDGYNVATRCKWTSNFQGSLRAKFQGSSWSRQSSCMLSTKKCPFMALQWLILFVVITSQDSVVKGEVCGNCSIDCSMCTCAPGTYGVAGGADGRGDWHKSDLCAIQRFMMSCLYRRQFIISWMTYHMLWWLSIQLIITCLSNTISKETVRSDLSLFFWSRCHPMWPMWSGKICEPVYVGAKVCWPMWWRSRQSSSGLWGSKHWRQPRNGLERQSARLRTSVSCQDCAAELDGLGINIARVLLFDKDERIHGPCLVFKFENILCDCTVTV